MRSRHLPCVTGQGESQVLRAVCHPLGRRKRRLAIQAMIRSCASQTVNAARTAQARNVVLEDGRGDAASAAGGRDPPGCGAAWRLLRAVVAATCHA